MSSGLYNYFVCKRFAIQILLWSLEFVIQINLVHNTIADKYVDLWNLSIYFTWKNIRKSHTMKLLGSTKSKITEDENGEYSSHIEITEVHLNIINNDYRQNSRVLYLFIPNKSFGQLSDISPKNLIFKNL